MDLQLLVSRGVINVILNSLHLELGWEGGGRGWVLCEMSRGMRGAEGVQQHHLCKTVFKSFESWPGGVVHLTGD